MYTYYQGSTALHHLRYTSNILATTHSDPNGVPDPIYLLLYFNSLVVQPTSTQYGVVCSIRHTPWGHLHLSLAISQFHLKMFTLLVSS